MDDLEQRIADLEAANKVLLEGHTALSVAYLHLRLNTVEDAWKKSRVAYAKLESRIKELENGTK